MQSSELRFCPKCTGELTLQTLEHEDLHHPVCVDCGFVLWQNPKPCVDALIIRNDSTQPEILLGRRANEPALGFWDVPGGFLNLGDNLETALIRECQREMGITVQVRKLLNAFDSQFFDSQTVTLVYVCELVAGEPTANEVIDQVEWFPLAAPPQLAFPDIEQAIRLLQSQLLS